MRYFSEKIVQPSIDLFQSQEIFFRDKLKSFNFIDAIIFTISMGILSSSIQVLFYFLDKKLVVGVGLTLLSVLLNRILVMSFRISLYEDLSLLISAFIYPILFLLFCFIWSIIFHLIWKILGAKKQFIDSYNAIAYCAIISPISSLLLIAANVYNFMADAFYNSFFALSLLAFLYFQNIIAIEIHGISTKKVWMSSIILWPIIISLTSILIYKN